MPNSQRTLIRKTYNFYRRRGLRATLIAIKNRIIRRKDNLVMSVSLSVGAIYDIIFIIGCREGESKRYRVYNIAEGLQDLGLKTLVLEDIDFIARFSLTTKVLVLFRMCDDVDGRVDDILSFVRSMGGRIIFDTDDLIFDPSICEEIGGYQLLSEEAKNEYKEGVELYNSLLSKVDLVTCSTAYLAEYVSQMTRRKAEVIPNSINKLQLELAKSLLLSHSKIEGGGEKVCIGYFSGTRTHNNDFETCSVVIEQILDQYPQAIFVLVGYLDLPESWQRFGDRVQKYGFMHYADMLSFLRENIDINIAPLEIGNKFCEGKSELKIFEAGLVEIPTIASATAAYSGAIDSGVDGILVRDASEWKLALENLIDAPALRIKMGKMARVRALKQFSYKNIAKIALQIFEIVNNNASIPVLQKSQSKPKLKIAWIVPGLLIGGGGHRNILRAAYYLSTFGHEIYLYFIDTEHDADKLKKLINEHFYPLDCFVEVFQGSIKPADVIFATHWTTVAIALTVRSMVQDILYFVQDFEPMFAPMGTEYILAENTYKLGLYHITSGPWCELLLRRDFHAKADHFQFPVDRTIYYPRARTYAKKNILFFAKPEMPRRCFELGVMALAEFHKLRPDYEIIMFGSPNINQELCPFPVTLKRILPTLNDLAELYSNADAGLVFSTTNPSLIPYEMMACGLPIVDFKRGNNEVNYDNSEDIALLTGSLPEEIAFEMAKLLSNQIEIKRRSKNGLSFVSKFPTEEEMAQRIEMLIIKHLQFLKGSVKALESK